MSGDELLARLLLDLAAVVAVAQLLRLVLGRLRQPKVLAEVLAGIALGPSLLGQLPGDLPTLLFPHQVRASLSFVGALGLAMFAFAVGLELDLSAMRRRGRALAGISAGALAVPFAVGIALAFALYGAHDQVHGHTVPAVPFTLFLATALSVTAFPVLVSILVERGMRCTRLGSLAISSAALQDVVGWVLLAAALAARSARGATPILLMLLEATGFCLLLGLVLRRVLRAGLARAGRGLGEADLFVIAVPYALACAGVSQLIGLHEVFGAFAAGVAFPRDGGRVNPHVVTRALSPITLALLLPIYFLTPGLQVDIGGLDARGAVELVLLVVAACGSKLIGTAIPARLNGLEWADAARLAVLLNTRGLMELVVLTVGYTQGVLDKRLFSELVLTALITTMATGPLLDLLRSRRPERYGAHEAPPDPDELEESPLAAGSPVARSVV